MEKDEEFYGECAKILGSDQKFIPNIISNRGRRSGRWGPRQPGNGRFPGFGTIRVFSDRHIHMALNKPESIIKTFDSKEKALEFLRELMSNE